MKKLNLFIIILIIPFFAFSQSTEAESMLKKQNNDTIQSWKKGGLFSVNLSQASLTNWAAGGQNSMSINGLISMFANYRNDNTSWENNLIIGYGMLKQGKENAIKTDDRIEITSKYGKKASKDFYYAGLINFMTQMAPGYNYPNDSDRISNLFAPAYLLGAIGMDYNPNDNFTAFLSPITLKTTFVNDEKLSDAGAFGVEKGEKVKTEIGGYFKIMWKKEIMKNVSFQTNLALFTNYKNNPQNIDINWDTMLAMKINEYLSANITTNLIYDDDIKIITDDNSNGGPRTQFKEMLGIGFAYNF